MVAEFAGKRVVGDDAEPDLVGDQHDRTRKRREGADEAAGLRGDVGAGQHEVREPQRQAVDEDGAVGAGEIGERADEVERRLDAVPLDAMARRDPNLRVVNTLTRKQPDGWMGRRGRIDKALLAQECFPPEQNPKIFVCGSTSFVEDVSRFLVELGHDPLTIKTERFGPSGGQAP